MKEARQSQNQRKIWSSNECYLGIHANDWSLVPGGGSEAVQSWLTPLGACVHYPWNLRFFQRHRQLHFSKHHLASCASRIHDELCCMLWYLHTAVHCLRFSYDPSFSCIIHLCFVPDQIETKPLSHAMQIRKVSARDMIEEENLKQKTTFTHNQVQSPQPNSNRERGILSE